MKEPTLLGSFPSPECPSQTVSSSPSSLPDFHPLIGPLLRVALGAPPAGPPFLLPLSSLPFAAISRGHEGAGATWDAVPFSYTMCGGALRFHAQVPGSAETSPCPVWPLFRDRVCEHLCTEGHLDCAWHRAWEPLSPRGCGPPSYSS